MGAAPCSEEEDGVTGFSSDYVATDPRKDGRGRKGKIDHRKKKKRVLQGFTSAYGATGPRKARKEGRFPCRNSDGSDRLLHRG